MSAWKAELIALTKALELRAGKKINICMDVRYAFATARVCRATITRERTAHNRGKRNKNKQEI